MTATGGTITTDGIYTIHTFTASGTFTPDTAGTVDVLVVAGGGGPGYTAWSGAGGGGGVIYETEHSVSATAYSVTVGNGGTQGNNGGNSAFDSLTAIGGGRGGTPTLAAASGGSGGGGANSVYRTGGAGTSGQGYAGSNGIDLSYDEFQYRLAGSGGGAGGAGIAASSL